jgi:hypothetical protein
MQKLKEIGKNEYFKIFDAKVQSILLYGSEVWGLSRLDTIEKVHSSGQAFSGCSAPHAEQDDIQ